MPDRLPPSLQRRHARNQHEAEERLLEKYAVLRDVRLAILWPGSGDPDADTWVVAAEEMGLTTKAVGEGIFLFLKDGTPMFAAIDGPGGAFTAVVT